MPAQQIPLHRTATETRQLARSACLERPRNSTVFAARGGIDAMSEILQSSLALLILSVQNTSGSLRRANIVHDAAFFASGLRGERTDRRTDGRTVGRPLSLTASHGYRISISIYNRGAGFRTRIASRRPFRPVQVNGPSAFQSLPLAVAPRSGSGPQHSRVCPDPELLQCKGSERIERARSACEILVYIYIYPYSLFHKYYWKKSAGWLLRGGEELPG